MANYSYFQNKECEYFPCHQNVKESEFNCLFCYCPLYALGVNCGGNFTYTQQGIKDCSNCTRPHQKNSYESIMKQMDKVIDLAKKP